MVSSVQAVTEFLQNSFTLEEQEPTPEGHGDAYTVEKITKLLNVEQLVKEQVEGNFNYRVGNLHRFFVYDNHTIETLTQTLNKYTQKTGQGLAYNVQKFFTNYEITLALPTTTGVPLVYTLSTPVYIGVKGKVQTDVPELRQTQKGYQVPKTLGVTTNVEVTVSTNTHGQISFIVPCEHKRFVSGYKKVVHVNVPVKGSVTVDLPKRNVKVEVKPVEKRGDYKLFHYSTVPYTAVQNILDLKPVSESPSFTVLNTKPLTVKTKTFGVKTLGTVFRTEIKTGKRNVDYKKLIHEVVQRHTLVSGVVFPTAEATIDNTNVDVYYDSKLSTVQSLVLSATYRQVTPTEIKHETDTGKVFVPTSDVQTRIKQFYEKVTTGVKGARAHVGDFVLNVNAQTPVELVGTFALAKSPVDAPVNLIGYFYKTAGNDHYEICYDSTFKSTYSPIYDLEHAIQSESKSDLNVHVKFGNKCDTGAKVVLTGKLERTPERQQYVQTLPQVQTCKTEVQQGNKYTANCRNATLQAGLFDKYTFNIKYEGVPEGLKNYTYRVVNTYTHLGYPYLTEGMPTQAAQQSKEVEFDVNFSPDLKNVNLYLSTPVGVSTFHSVPVGEYTRTLLVSHPVVNYVERYQWSAFQQQYKGENLFALNQKNYSLK